jgi:pimeloyl-ACP methyl ester carboxylesterase
VDRQASAEVCRELAATSFPQPAIQSPSLLVATVAPWLRPFPRHERAVLTAQFDAPEKREQVIDLFSNMGRDEGFVHDTAGLARRYLAQKPTLLLYGQFDPMRFVSLTSFKGLFMNSTVRIIPHEEHFPILSSGEQVGQAIHEWVRRLCGSVLPSPACRDKAGR